MNDENRTVYCAGWDRESTSRLDLFALFGKFGTLERLTMPRGTDGEIRGFCFAEFADPQSALSAIRELDGSDLNGSKLTVAPARPRPKRTD